MRGLMHSPHDPSQPLLPQTRPAQSATHVGCTAGGGCFFFFFFLRLASNPSGATKAESVAATTPLNAVRREAIVKIDRVKESKRWESTDSLSTTSRGQQ
jgi:hypothetical protein